MKPFANKLLLILHATVGTVCGLFVWVNVSTSYSHSYLKLAGNEWLWMVASLSVCVVTPVLLLCFFFRTIKAGTGYVQIVSCLTTAIGMPVINFGTGLLFTFLVGEENFYLTSDQGLKMLAAHTIQLIVAGCFIGLLIGGIAHLISAIRLKYFSMP